MHKLLVWLLLVPVVLGCSGQAELLGEPAAFSGKLTKADGSPLSNVLLTLQPLENGHPILLEVDASGTFQGSGVPGEYAYFVGVSAKSTSRGKGVLKSISADFLQAHLERKVRIGDSSQLNIELR